MPRRFDDLAVPAALTALGAVALVGLGACSGTAVTERPADLPPLTRYDAPLSAVEPGEGIKLEDHDGTYYDAGRTLIGSQPTEADLARLRAAGVGTIINLRSNAEMDNPDRVPFDQRAAVERLGMRYVHIPLGGDDGYEPADVDAFARALDETQGDALIHCASGGRARSMVSAWAITRRGWTHDQAEAWRRTVGQRPGSLERLLGEDQAPPDNPATSG